MEKYVSMHPSYFVPIVTFHLPWGACCAGWNDEESRNGGKSAQADDRDDKGHQTLVGVVCKRQGDEMQQKWVEKLGRGNRYICWSAVSTRVAMSHELGGEGGLVWFGLVYTLPKVLPTGPGGKPTRGQF